MRPVSTQWARTLAATVAAAVFGLCGGPAWAQVPGQQGFFGSLDGHWMWLGGDPVQTSQGSTSQSGNGPGGQMMLGYKISTNWDIALAGDVQGLMTQLTKMQNGVITIDTTHQHFDLEAGFSDGWWRVNAGLRGIHYTQTIAYNLVNFGGYDTREIYGIGPKIGAGARWGVSDNWSIVGGADAALLFGSFYDYGTGMFSANSGYSGIIPQVDAELGVNWRSSDNPLFSMTLGGRVTTSFNTSISGDSTHRGTMVEVGPFVRVAYNFAGPARAMAVTSDSDAPAATPAAPGGYVLFFDFDSDEISAIARSQIRRAADDARWGKTVTLRLTSHAERAGSPDYNGTLRQRRADAVKAELARLGAASDKVTIVF